MQKTKFPTDQGKFLWWHSHVPQLCGGKHGTHKQPPLQPNHPCPVGFEVHSKLLGCQHTCLTGTEFHLTSFVFWWIFLVSQWNTTESQSPGLYFTSSRLFFFQIYYKTHQDQPCPNVVLRSQSTTIEPSAFWYPSSIWQEVHQISINF